MLTCYDFLAKVNDVCEKNLTSSIGLIFLAEITLLKEQASINRNIEVQRANSHHNKANNPATTWLREGRTHDVSVTL
jgi:hypothetical protein